MPDHFHKLPTELQKKILHMAEEMHQRDAVARVDAVFDMLLSSDCTWKDSLDPVFPPSHEI
jgi:hypothetical protein